MTDKSFEPESADLGIRHWHTYLKILFKKQDFCAEQVLLLHLEVLIVGRVFDHCVVDLGLGGQILQALDGAHHSLDCQERG